MSSWLDKAREEFDHIEKSEYGQLTDGQIRQKENLRSWSKKANELGSVDGGNATWNKWVEELGEEGAKDKMREIQKMSIGVPKHYSEEARAKMSENGKKVMSSEESREIKSKGGKVAGPIAQSKTHYCEHCEEYIKGTIYYRHHGDKCQLKGIEKQDVIDMYNQPKMTLDKVANHFGISRNIVHKLVKKQ